MYSSLSYGKQDLLKKEFEIKLKVIVREIKLRGF
jgi:hypothetical protein